MGFEINKAYLVVLAVVLVALGYLVLSGEIDLIGLAKGGKGVSSGCADSDGRNYYTYGFVTSGASNYYDYCVDSTTVREYYCGKRGVNIAEYACPYGCSNGKCLQQTLKVIGETCLADSECESANCAQDLDLSNFACCPSGSCWHATALACEANGYETTQQHNGPEGYGYYACSNGNWILKTADYGIVKGMRFDPSWYYFRGYSARTLAQKIVNDAYNNNVNTVFMMTHNGTYAFYITAYQDIETEGGFGAQDMLGELITAAHAKNIKVVAWLPANNFKKTWENHPDWRSKGRDGKDYTPASGTYFLSAWHDSYQQWYAGFLNDLLARYPSLDGIEAAEGVVDWTWNLSADYNPAANQKYLAAYPSGTLGDHNWVLFRAQGLTKLHEILVQEAHAHSKKAYVVSGWAAKADGHLMESYEIRDGCGFDFDGIMNSQYKPDYVIAELIWQQWTTYNPPIFTPDWTLQATNEFLAKVNGRVGAIVHVEITPWPPDAPQVTPTNSQFETSLRHALSGTQGADFYDHNQAEIKGALANVKNVYTAS